MADDAGQTTDYVFISCPFDDEFTPLFRALIFGVYACLFEPRSARCIDDSGQTRIEKLYAIIAECRYGVHDLSRTELDPVSHLPRFNMPLELGLFLGGCHFGDAEQKRKRTLIFDTETYQYQRFISDLAGMDIHAHGGDPARAIVEVRDLLANVPRRKLPSGPQLARDFAAFQAHLPAIAEAPGFEGDAIPYVDFEQIVVSWLVEV